MISCDSSNPEVVKIPNQDISAVSVDDGGVERALLKHARPKIGKEQEEVFNNNTTEPARRSLGRFRSHNSFLLRSKVTICGTEETYSVELMI